MELSTKLTLAQTAKMLAQSYELIQHGTTTYIPTNYVTGEKGPCPSDVCIWMPMNRQDKRKMANHLGKVLFANDSEVTNFDLMLRQFATEIDDPASRLLIKTEDGLRALDEAGQLVEPHGAFLPNFIQPQLNTDEEAKTEVFSVIQGWLNSEVEAHSLLNHLATALSPGWSAVKYVILIGDGRNGKSVLLSMLMDLFGSSNVSEVTRQQIAERLPVCTELNGKLLNIIFDGEMAYIKDSSMEKTVIAGEPASVRLLYENGNTRVQTNALFLEALNSEPKTRDKSSALQKRLSRFWFPNVYSLDTAFERHMRSERMLGAFLALLLDHYVCEHEIAEKLQQTAGAKVLQVEQQLLNSPLLQFVQHLVQTDPVWIKRFEAGNLQVENLVAAFMAWRLDEGFNEYNSTDIKKMFREHFRVERKSLRENGKVVKREQIIGPKAEAQALFDQLKEEEDEDDGLLPEAMVAD